MPKVNAQATALKIYQRNSNNTGWNLNYEDNNTCYTRTPTNLDNLVKGQMLRWTFNDTLSANNNYTITFVVSTMNNLDYAWYRWGNDFGSGGILGSVGGYLIQQPTSGTTLSQSSMPMNNYVMYSKTSSITFDFSPNVSGTFSLDIPTYLFSYAQVCLDSYQIQVGGSSASGDSQSIINNNNINTQNIITNNNNNTNQIINNQNENTEKEIESQKVCKNKLYDYNDIVSSGYLGSTGTIAPTNNWGITDYISISKGTQIDFINPFVNAGIYFCYYDSSKTIISCPSYSSSSFVAPDNAKFARFSIRYSNQPQVSIVNCISGNQAISDDINDLNNTLNDTSIEGTSVGGKFAEIDTISDTPITDLLTMPLVLLNKLYDGVSGTCTAYVLPFGLTGGNQAITLPCFDGQRYLGSAWSIIDGLVCVFMLYNIGMMIIQFFESVTSLQDTFDSMYSPKHTYHPKHGGGN